MPEITADQITLFIQIGEKVVPIVVAAIDDIRAFVAARHGNVDVLAQLVANAQVINDTEKTLEAEIAETQDGVGRIKIV